MDKFVDRESKNPNRRMIKIIRQTADEIEADIIMHDEPEIGKEGTPITANKLNEIIDCVEEIEETVEVAKLTVTNANAKSDTAIDTSNTANNKSDIALSTANIANIKSNTAVETANDAKSKAEEALEQVVHSQGTKIFIANVETPESSITFNSDPQTQIDNKPGAIDYIETEQPSELGNGEVFNVVSSNSLRNRATARASHAEGNATKATGVCSHSEGSTTIAEGLSSHAEGESTHAKGRYSHSSGYGTIADQECQTVVGRLNKENSTGALFSVGNGTESNRQTAFEIFNDGSINLGNIKIIPQLDGFTIEIPD